MKELTNIKSETRPAEIDDFSSETTVYLRYNIEESIEVDPIFNTEKPVYTYNETQYSFAEWYRINNQQMKAKMDHLEEYLKKVGNVINLPYDI
jgi:hypothetical protein